MVSKIQMNGLNVGICFLLQTGYIRLHLDQQKLLHFLHLRRLLSRPLPLLGVDLGPPQPVLVIHRKTIMETILSIDLHHPRLYNSEPTY